MKKFAKAFLELIWEIIKMLLWLTLFVMLVPIIIPVKTLKLMFKVCKEQYKKSQEREKQMKIEQERTLKVINMVDDIRTWISTDFVNELKYINKKQKELAQYKSTQGKLTKNKELLQYINKRLREVNGTRIYISDLQQLTSNYDNNVYTWLEQLEDIEFKLNDSRIACEERIKRLEKKNEKTQAKQCSSDLSAR